MSNAWSHQASLAKPKNSIAKLWRLLLCSLAVAIVGCVGLLVLAPKPAEALYPPNTQPPAKFNPVTPEEFNYYQQMLEATKSTDPAKKAVARQIVRDNFVRYMPGMASKMIGKGGLASTAVGVWGVVGLELYFLPCWECDSEMVPGDYQVAKSLGSAWARYYGECTNPGDSSTCSLGLGSVNYAKCTRQANWNTSCSVYTNLQAVQWYHHLPPNESWRVTTPRGDVSGPLSGSWVRNPTSVSFQGTAKPLVPAVGTSTYTGNTTKEIKARISGNGPAAQEITLCPANSTNCTTNGMQPSIDVGDVGTTAGSDPLKAYPNQANGFINGVVSDPRSPDVLPGQTQPYQPPIFDPYKDPLGDPDADTIPNQTDPDPEGDGDPDVDGSPNEHPMLGPWPTPDDPENDGDTNHDGSPNEQFPPVYYDPYSPIDNPQGDPDRDGVPNIIDEDPADPDVGGHPWEYLPYGAPETEQQPWTTIRPPGEDVGDEYIFGPKRFPQAEEDESGVFVQQFGEEGRRTQRECWVDDTGDMWCQYWKEHGSAGSADWRMITVYFGTGQFPPFYIYTREDELNEAWNLLGACQPNLGNRMVHRIDHYADDTQRSTLFDDSVAVEDTDTATPLCKKWFDGNDNQISAPSDESPYPMREIPPHLPFVA